MDALHLIPLLVFLAAFAPFLGLLLVALAWRNPATTTAVILFILSCAYFAVVRALGG